MSKKKISQPVEESTPEPRIDIDAAKKRFEEKYGQLPPPSPLQWPVSSVVRSFQLAFYDVAERTQDIRAEAMDLLCLFAKEKFDRKKATDCVVHLLVAARQIECTYASVSTALSEEALANDSVSSSLATKEYDAARRKAERETTEPAEVQS